tara:strand:+ start:38 stop:169 length:132 start_codon:yes stop_codon:yes gene_type:complete
MKKWMWYLLGAAGVYVAYTMFMKPKDASDPAVSTAARNARARR